MTSGTNALGTFANNYVNAYTGRIDHVDYPGGMKVALRYFDNSGDNRLKEIQNLDPSSNVISQFDYTYDASGRIQTWKQFNSAMANPRQYGFGYDGSDWLTDASLTALNSPTATSGTLTNTLHYAYDDGGNRTGEQVGTAVTASTANNLNQLISQAGGNSLHVEGIINKPATVDVNGVFAPVDANLNFGADVPVTSGSNTIAVNATSTTGQVQTNRYSVNVTGGSSKTLVYDADGNTTDNGGTQTYEWDAENRLVAINYTGNTNRTEFKYNGLGQRVQIVEKANGSVASMKQFVWLPGDAQPGEERDGSNTVTKRFFPQGEQIGGANYYYTKDHLGSIREMTDLSGTIHARYDYDLWGRLTKVSGDMDSDFAYTGHYWHRPSGLYLAPFRAYNPDLGRWISRDPLEEQGGINLYGYVGNDPISRIDPLGLTWAESVGMFLNWATGQAPANQGFGPNTNQTNDMQYAPGVDAARNFYYKKNAGKPCKDQQPVTGYGAGFGLTGLWNAGFNSTQQFVGNYSVDIYPNSNGTLSFQLNNTTSMTSFLYGVYPNSFNPPSGTPGGNYSQTFSWNENNTSVQSTSSTRASGGGAGGSW